MNLLAKKLGIKVNYIHGYERSRYIEMLYDGSLDVMLNIIRTPKGEQSLHFTEPYAATPKSIFTNDPNLNTLSKLNHHNVCVPKNFFIEHFLHKYYPNIVLVYKKSVLDCLYSVEEGSSVATVGSNSILEYLRKKHHIKILHRSLITDKRLMTGLSIATAPQLEILRDILQKAMYSIKEDELLDLTTKWIEEESKKEIKPFSTKRIIKMCNNPNWAPIEFAKDGNMSKMSGIVIDILKIIEKRLNVSFETVPTKSWSQSQEYLKEGKCEILPAAIATEERKEYANFTAPYLIYKLAIITKNDKPFMNGLEDIRDKTIARKKGSGLISKLKNLYPDIHIIETKDYLDALQKVSTGEAYCTIATLPVASYFINRFSLQNLQISGYTDMKYKLSIAVNKKDSELLKILNRALSDISAQEQHKIYNKWINEKLVESFDYRYIYYSIAIALFILLLLYYRQQILKGANENLQKEIENQVNENLIQHQFIQEQAKLAAMGEMIGVIAHQWRQPLNALGLSIQNIKYNYEDGLVDEQFIKNFIDKNTKIIQFMSQTIDDFRDFFKVDRVKESFSAKESIEATFQMQSLDLEKYAISFFLHGDDFSLYGLRSEFQQVILNLISNAKDALIENREKDRVIDVYLEDNIIIFMDNGGGMSEESLNRVFESYYTTKKEGMGIGLHMSKIIIEEKFGGKINIYSKSDGTVVVLDMHVSSIEEGKGGEV